MRENYVAPKGANYLDPFSPRLTAWAKEFRPPRAGWDLRHSFHLVFQNEFSRTHAHYPR